MSFYLKFKILHFFLFCGIVIYTTPCFSSFNFFPGIKIGLNYNKLDFRQGGIGLPGDGFPRYYHPAGLVAGLFWENRLKNNLFLVTELSYMHISSRLTVYTTWEDIVEQEYHGQYIRFPCLLKYQIKWFISPYFSSGINFGYLLKANYKSSPLISKKEDFEISQKLPPIDISIDIGSGVQFKLPGIYILTEVRCLVGLSQNQYSRLGKWKNNTILFVLGMQLQ